MHLLEIDFHILSQYMEDLTQLALHVQIYLVYILDLT